jgi:hypothetical protein
VSSYTGHGSSTGVTATRGENGERREPVAWTEHSEPHWMWWTPDALRGPTAWERANRAALVDEPEA